MKLKVSFGLIDYKEVLWYRDLKDFPHIINYLGKNFEWVTYDSDPLFLVDHVLVFSEIPKYDRNFSVSCPIWTDLFKDTGSACECGALHSSFPWDHMKMCRLWRRW